MTVHTTVVVLVSHNVAAKHRSSKLLKINKLWFLELQIEILASNQVALYRYVKMVYWQYTLCKPELSKPLISLQSLKLLNI